MINIIYLSGGMYKMKIIKPTQEDIVMANEPSIENTGLVDKDGNTWQTNLGRAKIEKRPMMLVKGEFQGKMVTLVMQNAETIRLTDPKGKAVSIVTLKKGDEVLGFVEEGGRHFGMKIEETITEK